MNRWTTNREKICEKHIFDIGLLYRIYKELLQIVTRDNPTSRMLCKIFEEAPPWGRYMNGQSAHEKMLSIISHQENTNSN